MDHQQTLKRGSTDHMDLGTGKVNPQTHGSLGLNEDRDNTETTPEIEPVQPAEADIDPIKAEDDGKEKINREEEATLIPDSPNQAVKIFDNKNPEANPDNEPAQEGSGL